MMCEMLTTMNECCQFKFWGSKVLRGWGCTPTPSAKSDATDTKGAVSQTRTFSDEPNISVYLKIYDYVWPDNQLYTYNSQSLTGLGWNGLLHISFRHDGHSCHC